MTTGLKSSSVLGYDYGLFCSLFERLTRDFGKVGYFVPWENSFADGRELIVGDGLENITREKYWDDVYETYDLLVFPDVHNADLQEYYRRQGKKVWGAGKGAELELLRYKTKQRLEAEGLPMSEYHKVPGTAALRRFFQDHEDDIGWWVKISGLRGLGESWYARNYAEAKGQIDEFEHNHGPIAYVIDFVVEKSIPDADEIGYDGYNIGGEFPKSSLWGIEKKDKCYFGAVAPYADLPDGVKVVNEVLSKVIKKEFPSFAQSLSTEIREKDGKPYCIDLTIRHASPAGECLWENMANASEVIWWGAQGKLVDPEWEHKYVAQIILCSEAAMDYALPVSFPEEIRQFVKLYNHARIDDNGPIGIADYFIPQIAKMKQIGSVVATADDPKEACELCKERAQMVKGFEIEPEVDELDKAMEEVLSMQPA